MGFELLILGICAIGLVLFVINEVFFSERRSCECDSLKTEKSEDVK